MKPFEYGNTLTWVVMISLMTAGSLHTLADNPLRTEIAGYPGGVVITTTPPPGTMMYAVEETIPPDIVPRDISHGGVHDPVMSKVKWGPFADDHARDLSFTLPGAEGEVTFTGEASYDQAGGFATVGDDEVILPELETLYEGWQDRHLPGSVTPLPADHILPQSVQPMLIEYAMGREPGGSEALLQIVPGEPFAELKYTRDLRRSDVTLVLERSDDLLHWTEWTSPEVKSTLLDSNTEQVRVPVEESHRFHRIRADRH